MAVSGDTRRSVVDGEDQVSDHSFSGDEDDDRSEVQSNFRWSMQVISGQMGLAPSTDLRTSSSAVGRFAVDPLRPLIPLSVAAPTLTAMERVNRSITTSVQDLSKLEAKFPAWKTTSAAKTMYRSALTPSTNDRSMTSVVAEVDPNLGLIPRR